MIRIKCDGPVPKADNFSATDETGHELKFISGIRVEIAAGKPNRATIDIDHIAFINVEVEPMLSRDSLERMAEYYGMKLVDKRQNVSKIAIGADTDFGVSGDFVGKECLRD